MNGDAPSLGDLSPAGAIAVGITVGLLSTCVQSIGLTLQRKSHLLEEEKEDEGVRRPPYRRRRWQVGMAMFILSNLVGSTIQITTLPLPVLSTLQASGLVFNTLCASLILKERFTWWSLAGTSLVAGGALLIALFGALPEPSHNLEQLLVLLRREQFILWMVGTFAAIGAILLSILALGRYHTPTPSRRARLYRGFAYGAVSSVLSAHSLLVAKSAVELVVRTVVDHRNQFDRWQSWVILLLLVFFALAQLYFLHRGLKLVSTSILYPFVFCVYNIVAILDGLIYFRQTARLSALHAGLIALGTAVLLSGVLCLSWRLNEESDSPPPPDAHTLLTPGMGLVEDTTTEDERGSDDDGDDDIDDDNASVASADEDAAFPELAVAHESSPLLGGKGRSRMARELDDSLLHVKKTRRHQARTVRGGGVSPEEPNGHGAPDDELDGWTFPDPEAASAPPRQGEAGGARHVSTPADPRAHHHQHSRREHARHPPRSGWQHKRVRSDDLAIPVLGKRSSRLSSGSPSTPKLGVPRARTVHGGSSVSFAMPPHPATWRERDRDRRRRTWSRGAAAVGSPGAARARSSSAPQGPRGDVQSQARRASEPPGDDARDMAETRHVGNRRGSVFQWIGTFFGRREDK